MRSISLKEEIFGKVYTAVSLDEVRRIEAEIHKFSTISKILQFSVWIRVVLFNTFLHFLHFFLFKNKTPHDGEIKKIIVYLQGMLGDTAVHLPLVCSLKKKYPRAVMTVVSYNEQFSLESLLRPLSYIDNIIFTATQPVLRKGFSFNYSTNELASLTCDLFINFSPYGNRGVPGFLLREMIFAYKTKARFALGFHLNTLGKRGVLNRIQHYFVKNEPRRGEEIVSSLHLPETASAEFLPLRPEAQIQMIDKIGFTALNGRKIAVIHPGAKYYIKCWRPERFGKIAAWLKESYNIVVCITGLPHEEEIARQVVEASHGTAINLCGKTSQAELIELLRMSSLCLTNDTGTMHLAALLNIPMVALFNTRLSVTHWFPNASIVRALFSFDQNSYSFKDDNAYDPQMDVISVEAVQQAIKNLSLWYSNNEL